MLFLEIVAGCCIYEKPYAFDESSSDTDDECEHCSGHVELKKKSNSKAGILTLLCCYNAVGISDHSVTRPR